MRRRLPAHDRTVARITRVFATEGKPVGLLVIALLVALAGCRDEAPGRSAESHAAGEGARTADRMAGHATAGPDLAAGPSRPGAAGVAPVVELLAPGAEPRRVLRYRLEPGAEDTLVMKMRMEMRTEAPGTPTTPMETPTMEMTMHLRITERRSDTEARYEFLLQDTAVKRSPGMPIEIVETARAALARAEGMAGSAIIDTRGFNRDLTMKLPAGMPPQMEQMMDGAAQGIDRMSTPLPAEAVGVGARWKLHQTIIQNGVALQQETLFELIALDGDHCTLKATVTQTGGRQPMVIPGMPAGAVELIGLQSAGTGEIEIDLDRLVPNSTLTLGSEYTMQITAEEPQTVETRLDMHLEIARR